MKCIIFFLFSVCVFSQNTNKVIYKVSQVEDEAYVKNLSLELQSKLQQTKEEFRKLSLELIFNDSISVFKLSDGIRSNTVEEKLAISKAGANSDLYTNIIQNKSFRNNNIDFMHKPKEFLIYFDLEFDWKITSEKKMIDKIEVIKAVGKVYKNEKYQEVIAWFAPKLSYQYGPIGIGKLPGLILELQLGPMHYSINSIEFGVKDIEIKMPTEGKLVEIKEYFKQLRERYEELKKEVK